MITLIEITEDGYAVLQFGGGCNDYSMVDVTLKDGVEKRLVSLFPNESKGAKDITMTSRGNHFLLLVSYKRRFIMTALLKVRLFL